MNPGDKPIITGSITNTETGETHGMSHYLFCGGFAITTFSKVIGVESFEHEDGSFQIAVDCLSLDSIGDVYPMSLDFTPDEVEERDAILGDMNVGRILFLRGEYTMTPDRSITLHNPMYSRVPSDFSEDEIRHVFEFNGKQCGDVSDNAGP